MENGVRQDGDELLAIASDIEAYADEFRNRGREIFDEMSTRLGLDETSNKAWWGPQAELFLNEFKKKETEFTNAYNNIVSMSENLRSQAEAWNTFENA